MRVGKAAGSSPNLAGLRGGSRSLAGLVGGLVTDATLPTTAIRSPRCLLVPNQLLSL